MAFRSERVVTPALNSRVQMSFAPLKVRNLVLSVLSTNGARIAVGDRGSDSTLGQERGILFGPAVGGANALIGIGNNDPLDLSEMWLYGINAGDGITWTGDVVT